MVWAGEVLVLWRGPAMLAAGALGAIVGSFLGAALIRMPRGESVTSGRSKCDGCGRTLRVRDLVPIFSFLALRGRCGQCGASIDPWQLVAELGGLLVGVASAAFAGDAETLGLGLALGWQLLLLGLLDLRHFWLPDRLVLVLAATGAIAALLAARSDPAVLVGPALGALLGFSMLWVAAKAYRAWRGVDGLGAGDPKLLGAIGLWLGPLGVVATLLGGALAGLVGAVALALSGRSMTARTALPLGSCLALAAFAVYLGQT